MNQLLDNVGQHAFFAVKARDHRGQHFIRVESLEVERVSGVTGDQRKKGELRSAISLAESMDGVQFGKKMRGLVRKGRGVQIAKIVGFLQFVEKPRRLAFDVLG